MMGWDYGNGMGTGGWIAMIAMMSVFWGLVILAGVMIFRGNTSSPGRDSVRSDDHGYHRDPFDILDERFARGEIDSDEFEARRAVLRDSMGRSAFPR